MDNDIWSLIPALLSSIIGSFNISVNEKGLVFLSLPSSSSIGISLEELSSMIIGSDSFANSSNEKNRIKKEQKKSENFLIQIPKYY